MPSADPVVAPLRARAEPEREDRQGRDDQQDGDQGQLDVERQQEAGDHDHGEALDRELRQPVLEQLLQVLDVAGHAAHDHARLLLRVEVERQSLQMGEDLDPQVVHDPSGQPAGDFGHEALGDRGDGHGQQIEGRDHHDHAHVLVGAEAPVDPDADQRGAGLVEDADDGDQNGRQQPQLPVLENQTAQGQLLGGIARPAVVESDGWLGMRGLVGQKLVDAVLQLRRDAGKRQPVTGIAGRPAAPEHGDAAAHHAHQPIPLTSGPRRSEPPAENTPAPFRPSPSGGAPFAGDAGGAASHSSSSAHVSDSSRSSFSA